jgi:hypothetical protein
LNQFSNFTEYEYPFLVRQSKMPPPVDLAKAAQREISVSAKNPNPPKEQPWKYFVKISTTEQQLETVGKNFRLVGQ